MKKIKSFRKKILSAVLSLTMLAATLPTNFTFAKEDNESDLKLDNGYITAVVSKDNGGFMIRTAEGDKISKSDDNKDLLFHSDLDDTSFTSFQVTRNGDTKEYIFGGEYEGSSDVTVSQANNELTAVWSVDNIVFTQTLKLVNSGSDEHGMVYISYQAENQGEPADIKARVLLDTALGQQDYAYYRIGGDTVGAERTFGSDGYDKTFYAYDDPFAPQIVAYIVNASIADAECKPYQMKVAHWSNLASTVFDYETDSDLTFTNPNNRKHLTADSATALYYDLGNVAQGAESMAAFNYGVFSHENVDAGTQATFDVTAPDALELTEDMTAYKDNGVFSVVSNVKNISDKTYDRVKVVVQSTKGIVPLDAEGNEVQASYENPYTYEWIEFKPSQTQETTWKFKATPDAEGVYSKISFQIYDVSDGATMNTGELMAENLLGEGRTYILCPGSVTKVPAIKFTGSTPDTLYVEGDRTLNITGENFSMLVNKSEYKMMVSRVDGMEWNGITEFEIPSNSFSIDEINNTMTVKIDESMPKLAEGQYQITFDYTAADKEDITATALQFMVKDNVKYKNDTYGVLAVIKNNSDEGIRYSVQKFADEEAYNSYLEQGADRDNVLLEFKGKFTLKSENGVNKFTALSRDGSDNVVTLNNCLDIENGTAIVTENDGSVYVDFDANIYTTGSRTSVFKGVCGLTELEKGNDYGLIEYNEEGERDDDEPDYETITLLWPSVGQAAQNLLGMLFDFKYGELGVIKYEDNESAQTRVIAFGASLDLSFTIPESSDVADDTGSELSKALDEIAKMPGYSADDLRNVNKEIPYNTNTKPRANQNNNNNNDEENDDDGKEFSTSVEINDVLFGGKYLGVNFCVGIGVPSLVNGMPDMEATLEINTVGDWSVGVEGECEFTSFVLEAGIKIKSKDNIPVPDSLHFFMGGFVPGINVDGFGVLWLQGAGGGIENLYDTVFLKDAVPPLKLIIEAQFSLMQIISARAKLELSLRGIGVELSEGKIANSLEVLESAKLQLDWYPEFYFMSSAYLNIEDIIQGGGYIVVEQSGFFEFFVKAAIGVPDSVPLIGGMELASVGLGVNTEKIWGKVNLLFVDFGIVYYWGGDFNWNGGAGVEPTYPDLLGSTGGIGNDVPIYYDNDTGRTLYARVGTNLNKQDIQVVTQDKLVSSELYTADLENGVSAYSKNALKTNLDGSEYVLTLAPKQKNELVTVEWSADSMEDAKKQANQVKITNCDLEDETYAITFLEHGKDAESQNANANLTYDSETGKATMCVSFTKNEDFNKQWKIEAGQLKNVQVTLYDVESMPELSESETKLELDKTDNSKVSVTLKGNNLSEFKNISVIAKKKESASLIKYLPDSISAQSLKSTSWFLTNSANNAENESEQGTLLYYEEKPEGYSDGDVLTFDMPEELESGDYDIQIIAKDSNEKYNSFVDLSLDYENKNAPKVVSKVSALKNAGNYQLEFTVEKPDNSDIDGYTVSVYGENGKKVSGLADMMFNVDGSGSIFNDDGSIHTVSDKPASTVISVGGQYTYTDEQTGEEKLMGLEAGKSYRVGVRSWKLTDRGTRVMSEEKFSGLTSVRKPADVNITFAADKKHVVATDSRTTASGEAVTFETPTYADSNITITATADSEITGSWKLDSGDTAESTGTFDNASDKIEIPLKNVTDGAHILTVRGTNKNGDSFQKTYTFGIDTLAPRMLLSAPISGTVFSNGTLEIAGVTDSDTYFTVVDNTTGKKLMDKQKVNVDEEGRFTASVAIDESMASHKLTISASDELGNTTEKQVDVLSGKLGQIEALALYADGKDVTNDMLEVGKSYNLNLMAKLKDGSTMEINDTSLVDWQETVMEGNADIEQDEDSVVLTIEDKACGMVTARYLVNSAGVYSVSAAFTSENKSEEPGDTGTPAVTETPEVTETPAVIGTPVVTETPGTVQTPEITDKSGTIQTPEVTTTAGISKTPVATDNAGSSKEPDNKTSKPGKTGDTFNIALPLFIMIISGTAIIISRRRYRG